MSVTKIVGATFDPAETAELAYTAGFFDGEGCVGTYSGKLMAIMSQKTVLTPLIRAKARWGGSMYTDKRTAVVSLRFTGRFALAFIRAIRPWLLVKQAMVDEEISRWGTHHWRPYSFTPGIAACGHRKSLYGGSLRCVSCTQKRTRQRREAMRA